MQALNKAENNRQLAGVLAPYFCIMWIGWVGGASGIVI
jgi:hypothetical protein